LSHHESIGPKFEGEKIWEIEYHPPGTFLNIVQKGGDYRIWGLSISLA
jgi:hypothetical protein